MKIKYLAPQHFKMRFFLLPMVLAVLVFTGSSCGVTKQSQYFKTLQSKDTTLQSFVSRDFESKIVNGDRLTILISSLSIEEDRLFNLAAPSASGVAGAAAVTGGGFLVDEEGTVNLHRLGKTKAAGLTRRELARSIETKMASYAKEPIVQVNYINHKLTVMGAVERPQVLNLPEEQITLLDALVLSGDVSPNADKSRITIIREEGNEKKVKHVNLEDHSIFSSPWYYVKPNDIILVSADYASIEKEEKRRRLQTTLSLVASGVSLLVIILDRIIN